MLYSLLLKSDVDVAEYERTLGKMQCKDPDMVPLNPGKLIMLVVVLVLFQKVLFEQNTMTIYTTK